MKENLDLRGGKKWRKEAGCVGGGDLDLGDKRFLEERFPFFGRGQEEWVK